MCIMPRRTHTHMHTRVLIQCIRAHTLQGVCHKVPFTKPMLYTTLSPRWAYVFTLVCVRFVWPKRAYYATEASAQQHQKAKQSSDVPFATIADGKRSIRTDAADANADDDDDDDGIHSCMFVCVWVCDTTSGVPRVCTQTNTLAHKTQKVFNIQHRVHNTAGFMGVVCGWMDGGHPCARRVRRQNRVFFFCVLCCPD